jgi:ribosomal protein L34
MHPGAESRSLGFRVENASRGGEQEFVRWMGLCMGVKRRRGEESRGFEARENASAGEKILMERNRDFHALETTN